jgi:hypothetical protein
MESTNGNGFRKAILYARVSTDSAAPGPLPMRTGPPLPARAGVRVARLLTEGAPKPREVAARQAKTPTVFSPGSPHMNGVGTAPHQPLVSRSWQEEGIGADVTLRRTATVRATPPLAPTSDAPHDATRQSAGKPPMRWISTGRSGRWERSS